MKTYFITSDIHGFYNEFIKALDKSGFDKEDPNHILVICGDIFDRGKQPLQIYQFLKSLPKERRVLIRGNHEILLTELYDRKYPLYHDEYNGTFDTLAYIAKKPPKQKYLKNLYKKLLKNDNTDNNLLEKIPAAGIDYNNKVFNNKKIKEIINWINSDEWVNYYELTNYIFVHSFIPTKSNKYDKEVYFGGLSTKEEYDPDWRNAIDEDWNDAMWGCPWKKVYLNKTNKIIICGHWYTSDFWNNLIYKNSGIVLDIRKDNPIFRKEGINLIGLDACTTLTKGINILVMSEDELHLKFYDHNKEDLNE